MPQSCFFPTFSPSQLLFFRLPPSHFRLLVIPPSQLLFFRLPHSDFRLPVIPPSHLLHLPNFIFSAFRLPTSDFQPFPPSQLFFPPSAFPLPNSNASVLLFPQNLVHHHLGVSRGIGTGSVTAYVGGGFAFDDLQTVSVSGKFSQPLRILIRFYDGYFIR